MANISGHNVTVSGVTGVTEVTGHSRVPEQQVKGEGGRGTGGVKLRSSQAPGWRPEGRLPGVVCSSFLEDPKVDLEDELSEDRRTKSNPADPDEN